MESKTLKTGLPKVTQLAGIVPKGEKPKKDITLAQIIEKPHRPVRCKSRKCRVSPTMPKLRR